MTMLREKDGKRSFSRMFGAALLLSVLVGWWFAGFSLAGFKLPDMTSTLLAIGVAPYGLNKVSEAVASIGRKNA